MTTTDSGEKASFETGSFETMYIESTEALLALCAELESQPWLALDTEFLRERTYYAKLCLIQIAAPGRIVCVDPLAIEDLDVLAELLAGPQPKILHAARQDLEVFWQRLQMIPETLFDTQLAAAFCGYGDQVSYAALVSELVGIDLPKAHTRTDWSRRPLSSAQIDYAHSDVEYLPVLQQHFAQRLDELGRAEWFEQECRLLTDPALYQQFPETAWQRLKGGAQLPPESQQVAKRLAAWREERAQRRDLPREWVLRSNALLQIARRMPRAPQELAEVEELHPKTLQQFGDAILALVDAGGDETGEPVWRDSEPLSGAEKKLARQLMVLLKQHAESVRIAPVLIANRRAIEQLARGRRDLPLLEGWRYELVGGEMIKVIDGF
ncbi:MAG: ribonuclease D [Pseudomonadota bacterium]|nr:ribonuclease D [Pseudomonadota bacterium]